MKYEDILKLPYITFVLGMLDAPQIDYDKKEKEIHEPKTAGDEANSLIGALS